MRFDGNEPDFIKQIALEMGVYDKDQATPNEDKIKSYLAGIAILNVWKGNGFCTFQADNVQVMQKCHYISVEWNADKVGDEMFTGFEFGKLVELFDNVTPNEDHNGIMLLCSSLYDPI